MTILTRILQRINGTFDILTHKETLLSLRSQRWNLLETLEQYNFSEKIPVSAMANDLISVANQVEERKTQVASRKPHTTSYQRVTQRAAAASASASYEDNNEIVEEAKV